MLQYDPPHDQDQFIAKMNAIIQEHYVGRAEYDALKKDFELLQSEHQRSKQIFQKKLEEWEALKQSLKSNTSPSANKISTKNPEEDHLMNIKPVPKEENLHMPKAPRLGNKASKRMILGGDTPPGFWSTRFTPEA